MRVVIQCAGTKKPGGYFRSGEGFPVKFVAHPELASELDREERVLARPDDIAGAGGRTWRQLVLQYNETSQESGNPASLWLAYKLYSNPIYARLVERFGPTKVFILSAGWGLIRADFLTPNYDVTFSGSAEAVQRRRRGDRYDDYNQLPEGGDEPTVFLGGKDYQPLFLRLTQNTKGPRCIYFNSGSTPIAPGCRLVRFETTLRTNWQYECAEQLAAGKLVL